MWSPEPALYLVGVAKTRRRTTRHPRRKKRARARGTLDPFALRRRLSKRRLASLTLACLIILAIALLDHAAGVLPVGDDWHRYHDRSFEVARVIDGDTIVLRVPDGDSATTTVRLWGVDTPELAKPGTERPAEPFAEAATAFTRELVQGSRVRLELQDHRLRGRYGRLLAYVVLADGSVLNAELIEHGLSKHDDRWGHDRSADYAELERRARAEKRGLWSD